MTFKFRSVKDCKHTDADRSKRWYCGRTSPRWQRKLLEKGLNTESALFNAHRRKGRRPGSTLPDYRDDLWKKMKALDMPVLNELMAIDDDTVLVCWCGNSEYCHTSVIDRARRWLQSPAGASLRKKWAARQAKAKRTHERKMALAAQAVDAVKA